jgi:hypothetical protein
VRECLFVRCGPWTSRWSTAQVKASSVKAGKGINSVKAFTGLDKGVFTRARVALRACGWPAYRPAPPHPARVVQEPPESAARVGYATVIAAVTRLCNVTIAAACHRGGHYAHACAPAGARPRGPTALAALRRDSVAVR